MRIGRWLLLFFVIAPAGAARGEGVDEDVDRLHTEGIVLYRAGKYRQALANFEAAHAKFPNTNILFNIAKCHEALGDADHAIEAYEAVLRQANVEPELAGRASQRIELLRAARMRSKTDAIEDDPPVRALPPALAPAASTNVEPSSSGWLGVTKWTVGAIGLASMVGGGVAFALGQRDHAELRRAKEGAGEGGIASLTRVRAEALQSSGTEKKVVGYAALGAGGVMTILSAVFFSLDGDGADVTLSGLATSQSAGLALSGRF